MAVVLVTGMSGAGKSTVLAELALRGHAVVDTDDPGWIRSRRIPGQDAPEPLWIEHRITALLDGHRDGHLFIGGTVANQGTFYPRFDAVVLLTAPVEVLLGRIASRTGNDFGKSPDERAKVVADTAAVEPLLRAGATVEIDVRRPLPEVVEAVLATATTGVHGRL